MDQPQYISAVQGRYELREKLGAGGSAVVYKAWDTKLHRFVAFKRLHPIDDVDKGAVERMWREAMNLASIQHPNILTIFDSGIEDEGPYVVTEYLEGEPLNGILEKGVFKVEAFDEAARQLLEALIAAHHSGLIHRDLKPQNIMALQMPSGALQFKILDFGLAKFTSKPTEQTMEGNRAIYGSIYFIAPEQLAHKPLDARTDLYALGCVFYSMLTGQSPFHGETLAEIVSNHLQHKVLPLHEVRPGLPQPLCDWVMKMMSFYPDDRFQTAAEALAEFKKLLIALQESESKAAHKGKVIHLKHTEPSEAAPAQPTAPEPEKQKAPSEPAKPAKKKNWMVINAVSLTVLLVVGYAVTHRAKPAAKTAPAKQAAAPQPAPAAPAKSKTKEPAKKTAEPAKAVEEPAAPLLDVPLDEGVFSPDVTENLKAMAGQPITIEGIVANVKTVKKNNSFTLNFLTKSWESVSLSIQVGADDREWVVKNLRDKKKQRIRVQGTLEEAGGYQITVTDLKQLKVITP